MANTILEILKELYIDARQSAVFNDEKQDKLTIQQDFLVMNMGLPNMCTKPSEWSLVREIGNRLKKGICLFYLPESYKRSSSAIQIAIARFKERRIIYTTEITNLYVANPYFIRRGTILGVFLTTIKAIENEGLSKDIITDRKQVKIEVHPMRQVG